ncbi:MAG: FAD-dependent thymidylate synthase [Synergistaceae bacterium]|jgi:thymidylate synthase (FAD)|nr:FAD-dependent thymidylate synthase [Synergistaceae bacterium]
MSCKVYLLRHTPDPDDLVVAAARICYNDISAGNLLKRKEESSEESSSERLLKELWRGGHHSPFEHVSFTFGVDGLSRVTSHQLVRHRVASYSQQSQRYVHMDRPEVVMPPSVASDPESCALFEGQVEAAHEVYKALMERGVPAEDARFILPHGWETRLVLTMNARELHHFFNLRLCRRAQWEIRELSRLMLSQCRKAAPLVFSLAGPSCVMGRCEEVRPCGRPYKNMEDLLATNE